MNLSPCSRFLGIEIQESAVHAVLLQRDRRGFALTGFAIETLPSLPGQQPVQRIIAALHQALRRLPGSRTRRAAFALPDSLVAQHRCTLPAGLAEDTLETALFAEAEGLLPYPIEELVLDYRVLPGTGADAGRTAAEMAVCRRRTLEQLQAIAQNAGLQAVSAEPAAAAQARGQQMLDGPGKGDVPALRLEAIPAPAEQRALSLACGLAAGGGFNLLPWREWRRRTANRKFMAAALAAALLAQAPLLAEHRQLQAQREDWQEHNEVLSLRTGKLVREAAALRQEREEAALLTERMHVMHDWRQQQRAVLEMLISLGHTLPPGLRLQQVSLHGAELELQGRALSIEEVNLFLASAEQNAPWRNARISGIETGKDSEQQVHFKMRAQLALPGNTD